MENLNDLIWTDENDEADTQDAGMHEVCMIAFCDHSISVGGDTAGNFYACGPDSPYRSIPCI